MTLKHLNKNIPQFWISGTCFTRTSTSWKPSFSLNKKDFLQQLTLIMKTSLNIQSQYSKIKENTLKKLLKTITLTIKF